MHAAMVRLAVPPHAYAGSSPFSGTTLLPSGPTARPSLLRGTWPTHLSLDAMLSLIHMSAKLPAPRPGKHAVASHSRDVSVSGSRAPRGHSLHQDEKTQATRA